MSSPDVFTRRSVTRLILAMALGLVLYAIALAILNASVDPFPLSTTTVVLVGAASMFGPALLVLFVESIFRRRVKPDS